MGVTMSLFDPSDPRGRPKGARQTVNQFRRDRKEQAGAERGAASNEEGSRLTRRRRAVGLSVEELADRVGYSSVGLREVESGVTTNEVTMKQWIDLVWATRESFPDERRSMAPGERTKWVAMQGHFLAEAELVVNEMLGLYD
jgi:hypothetical protein